MACSIKQTKDESDKLVASLKSMQGTKVQTPEYKALYEQGKAAKEEYEALKSMPDGYFDMKQAEILRDASIKAAKIEANARTESVREQTRALNNTVDALAKTMKENK